MARRTGGQAQNQNNGGNVEMAKQETLVSTIKFCRAVGINNPQQMYQLIQKDAGTGKQIPKNVIQYQQVGEKFQPFFKLESATKWWEDRKAKNAAKRPANVVQNADQVLARFVDMVDQVAKEDPEVAKLAELLAKVMKSQGGVQ